jgi:hypothetical protein
MFPVDNSFKRGQKLLLVPDSATLVEVIANRAEHRLKITNRQSLALLVCPRPPDGYAKQQAH